jgi:rhamnulokinase
MTGPLYIAVDLGAGSGRVFLAGVDPGEFLLEEMHRFTYPPREIDGHLRWDIARIFDEIKLGLRKGGSRAIEIGRRVESIGIDGWGVDYGLIDGAGNLIADPVCYRDDRTRGVMEKVFGIVLRSEIFEKTGIQFLNINTLFQLFAEDEDLGKAEKLLLLPDLFNFYLTGKIAAEYTNATTTQMVNAVSGEWDGDLFERVNIPARILPEIIPAGRALGELKPEIGVELGLQGITVIAPATHDTGSAIAGAPLQRDWAYISSGTWSLIGVESSEPLINEEVARQNFTNEGGVYGTFRFLKNVMGLWIFESCRREWAASGIDVTYENLLRNVKAGKPFETFVFPDDERFLNPPSMLDAIRSQLDETGQHFDDAPAATSRVIFDSLAFRYASVLRGIESLTGVKLAGIQVLGGGGKNRYLNQATANAARLEVVAGPEESTVIGNVLVQAISSGRFKSLAEARDHVSGNFSFERFSPVRPAGLDEALKRYQAIEDRFV